MIALVRWHKAWPWTTTKVDPKVAEGRYDSDANG